MARIRLITTALIIILLSTLLADCSTTRPLATQTTQDGVPAGNVDVSKIPNATPKNEPKSSYGNPPSYVAAGHRYFVLNSANGYTKNGIASWYGSKFQGQRTSSHELYNPWAMTAASPDLPIPSYVKVTNLDNGKQVVVKVNDRGPFAANRIIDLSYAAATKLGYSNRGTARVQVSAVSLNPAVIPVSTKLATQPQLYLQVGAFNQYANAQEVKQSIAHLIGNGASIKSMASNSGHQTLYRVEVGPFKSVQESKQVFAKLQQHGFNQAMTVIS